MGLQGQSALARQLVHVREALEPSGINLYSSSSRLVATANDVVEFVSYCWTKVFRIGSRPTLRRTRLGRLGSGTGTPRTFSRPLPCPGVRGFR